jgi:hypothetical protein
MVRGTSQTTEHPGRFANEYRRMFGEYPSEVLRRHAPRV